MSYSSSIVNGSLAVCSIFFSNPSFKETIALLFCFFQGDRTSELRVLHPGMIFRDVVWSGSKKRDFRSSELVVSYEIYLYGTRTTFWPTIAVRSFIRMATKESQKTKPR
jgi:hypothetical protein